MSNKIIQCNHCNEEISAEDFIVVFEGNTVLHDVCLSDYLMLYHEWEVEDISYEKALAEFGEDEDDLI